MFKVHRVQLFIVSLLFFMILPVYGNSGGYKNNLLAINLQKNENNSLDLTIFSSKKFSSNISAIKKDYGEYVIILPDTIHSITSRPDISKTNGLISNIDVKLLPYSEINSNNGYTRIILKSNTGNLKININNKIVPKNSEIELEQILSSNKTHPKAVVLKKQNTILANNTQKNIVKPQIASNVTTVKAPVPVRTLNNNNSVKASTLIFANKLTEKALNSQPFHKTQTVSIVSTVKKPISVTTFTASKPEKSSTNVVNPENKVIEKIHNSQKPQQIKTASTIPTVNMPIPAKTLTKNNSENISKNYYSFLLENKKIFYIIVIGSIIFPLLLLLFFLKVFSFITGKNRNKLPDKDQMTERLNLMKNETASFGEENILNSIEKDQTNVQQEDFAAVFASSEAENKIQETDYNFNNVVNSTGGIILPKIEEEIEEDFNDIVNDAITLDEDIIFQEVEEQKIPVEYQNYEEENEDDDFSDMFEEETQETQEIEAEPLIEEYDFEIKKDEPVILIEKKISNDKILYLVVLNGEFSLVGMLNEQVFVLHRFIEEPTGETINFKLNETKQSEKIYIIQIDKWRALIGISDEKMRYILTL
ncbi:MAG: hypothetical protein WC197_03375 [Candidatus Gastranaerophilaceae bacterium]